MRAGAPAVSSRSSHPRPPSRRAPFCTCARRRARVSLLSQSPLFLSITASQQVLSFIYLISCSIVSGGGGPLLFDTTRIVGARAKVEEVCGVLYLQKRLFPLLVVYRRRFKCQEARAGVVGEPVRSVGNIRSCPENTLDTLIITSEIGTMGLLRTAYDAHCCTTTQSLPSLSKVILDESLLLICTAPPEHCRGVKQMEFGCRFPGA